jgi:hypothetical protein
LINFTRMAEGDLLSASQWNEMCDALEAWMLEQSPRRLIEKGVVSSREELPFGFFAEITSMDHQGGGSESGSDPKYGFRAVRRINGVLAEADPPFKGDGITVYAVEMTNQEIEIGSVQFLVPGSRAPYEFVKAGGDGAPPPPAECSFQAVTCVRIDEGGHLKVEKTRFNKGDCSVISVQCETDPEDCCNGDPVACGNLGGALAPDGTELTTDSRFYTRICELRVLSGPVQFDLEPLCIPMRCNECFGVLDANSGILPIGVNAQGHCAQDIGTGALGYPWLAVTGRDKNDGQPVYLAVIGRIWVENLGSLVPKSELRIWASRTNPGVYPDDLFYPRVFHLIRLGSFGPQFWPSFLFHESGPRVVPTPFFGDIQTVVDVELGYGSCGSAGDLLPACAVVEPDPP